MNRKRWTLPLFLLALLVFIVAPVQAAEGVQVTLTPDRNELTVGDPLQVTLEVTHPAGYQVIIPKLDQNWGDFEVRGQSQATTTANDDGTETTRQIIEVTLFNLGEFHTPAMPLTVGDGAGQVFEAEVPSVSLKVVPTLAEDDSELRDIKPQATLNVPPAWPWIAGSLVLAVLVAIAGWWAYRRWRGQPFGLAPAVDNRPPWQVAYDELARIESLGLLEQRRFKEYYSLVTDCLRTYLEQQFGLRVTDRTTSELRLVLRSSELEPDHARSFLDLFAESDLVKFAKFTPDLETARRLVEGARRLVTLTYGRALHHDPALTQPMLESELEAFLTGDRAAPVAPPRLSYQSGQ